MFLNWFLYTRLRTKKVIIYSDHDSFYLISGVKPVVYCKVYILTHVSTHDLIGRCTVDLHSVPSRGALFNHVARVGLCSDTF